MNDVFYPTVKTIFKAAIIGQNKDGIGEIFYNSTDQIFNSTLNSTDGFNMTSNYSYLTTTPEGILTSYEPEAICNLQEFYKGYREIHGWLSLCVCIFGTIANILNIVVLTRKEMNGSPINLILTGIAIADMLVMIEYIPFTLHRNLLTGRSKEAEYSWGFSLFVWSHSNFSLVIHAVSIWLTLSLAVWRFIMIRFHTLSPIYCTLQRCKVMLFLAYIIPVFLCIPNYIATTINKKTNQGKIIYVLDWSEIATAHNKLLYRINIWLYTFLLKLIPCIVLTIITGWLIKALYKAEERSARLKNRVQLSANNNSTKVTISNGSRRVAGSINSRKRSTDRTTRLLVVILILFLLTEFPQGILGMLSAIYGDQFFKDCYLPLGDVMDAMALTNSAINFILYCVMSKQFRKTFVQTFGCKSISSPGRQTNLIVNKCGNDSTTVRIRGNTIPSQRRSALNLKSSNFPEEIPMIITRGFENSTIKDDRIIKEEEEVDKRDGD
ncbi:G-protein coupled receptor dmsr-1 [Lepeophtheirus salmonis]|uniref:G-protein coupled receptor dmsr-1 n=1 Tax=Lepeophtheirus salmonis TaxID=72036 RepID=UPI001AE28923|nr:G-protein coupled receptor dmsr-1-like [Lepeophtheirus salmonis]